MSDPGAIFDRAWGSKNFWELRAMGAEARAKKERDEANKWFDRPMMDDGGGAYIEWDASNLTYRPTARLFDGSHQSNAYLKEIAGKNSTLYKTMLRYVDQVNTGPDGQPTIKQSTIDRIEDAPNGEKFIITRNQEDGPATISERSLVGEPPMPISLSNLEKMIGVELMLKKEKAQPGYIATIKGMKAEKEYRNAAADIEWAQRAAGWADLALSPEFSVLSPDEQRIVFNSYLDDWQIAVDDKQPTTDSPTPTPTPTPTPATTVSEPIEPKSYDELIADGWEFDPQRMVYTKTDAQGKVSTRVDREFKDTLLGKTIDYITSSPTAKDKYDKLMLDLEKAEEKLNKHPDPGSALHMAALREIKRTRKKLDDLAYEAMPKSNSEHNGKKTSTNTKEGEQIDAGAVANFFTEEDFDEFVSFMESGQSGNFKQSDTYKDSLQGIKDQELQEMLKKKGITNLNEFITSKKLTAQEAFQVAELAAREAAFDVAAVYGPTGASQIMDIANDNMAVLYNRVIRGEPFVSFESMTDRTRVHNAQTTLNQAVQKDIYELAKDDAYGDEGERWMKVFYGTDPDNSNIVNKYAVDFRQNPEAQGFLTDKMNKASLYSRSILDGTLKPGDPGYEEARLALRSTSVYIAQAMMNIAYHNYNNSKGAIRKAWARWWGMDPTGDYVNSRLNGALSLITPKYNGNGELVEFGFNLSGMGEDRTGPPLRFTADNMKKFFGDAAEKSLLAYFSIDPNWRD